MPPLPRTAWLEIDLEALTSNLALTRRLAGAGVPVFPVVKADAYGHGAVPVALALEAAGADGFCVAAFDEAVQLRDAGITRPILVLYPIPPQLAPEAARRDVATTVGDAALLAELDAVVRGSGWPVDRRLDVHLEVETGLGRGGARDDGLLGALTTLTGNPRLRLVGLWTHLQAPEDRERTRRQLAAFDAAASLIRKHGHELPPRHAAASGGLLLGNVAALDGVRPGLAIYGLTPDELLDDRSPAATAGAADASSARASAAEELAAEATALRPVLSLHARPVRVVDLPAGWGIGYGPSFVTQRPSRIATLPLGYGDGWPRSLSNRAGVLVRGQRVPLVGNVAMDAVMVDVTDVAGESVSVADEFVLIGGQGEASISVAELAAARSTNSWEVVTAMARRLPRVYHAGSGPVGVRTLDSGPVAAGEAASSRRSDGS